MSRASSSSPPSEVRGRWTASVVAAIILILVVAAAVLMVLRPDRSAAERVEAEHSVTLPASAREIQALGDASGSLWSIVNLDRGASSLLVIDRADVPGLLMSFGFDPDDPGDALGQFDCFGGISSPAPGNSRYRPASLPWPSDAIPEAGYQTFDTPGSADVACVFLYPMDSADSVGVWLYSDWN